MPRNPLSSILRDAWTPADRREPWRWCEDHIKSIPYSPLPGPFRSENSPWIREVMEAIVDPKIRLVSIIAAVQSSKTTSPELTLCYIIANLPGPCLWLDQTDEDAKDESESRLQKLFESCEPVKKLFPKNKNKQRNCTIHFSNGMTLWLLGAYNKTNLQRRSIRWLFGDETWRWPVGHMAEAEARTTAFGWLGKCVFMSQGGEENDDTHRKFETTDMREWHYKCPKCGKYIPYKWENIEWDDDCKDENGEYDFSKINHSTALKCPECGEYFEDSDRMRRILNKDGKFIALNPNASKENVGFHWNALASMSWGKLAELYLRAKIAARKGDSSLLQQFYQKRLALAWREFAEDYRLEIASGSYNSGDAWGDEAGFNKLGEIIAPPFAENEVIAPLRIMSVDVQMNCFYLVVRAWSINGSSRLLWHEKVLTWEDIEEIQKRFKILNNLVFVDAGYNSFEVYKHCGERNWIALMGDNRANFFHRLPNGKTVLRFYSPVKHIFISRYVKCRMHFWSNLNVKDTLARIRRNQNPADGATWEVPTDISEDYLKQMESEHRIKKGNSWIWEQIGNRPNHYLDCEAMNCAGALMLKIVGNAAT
ncbi:terminase gpA endonuclease subunit [Opitutia bacterium KCR 482]|nr:phage terminase large subunit family protein [Opitutae bacterium KCR 482]